MARLPRLDLPGIPQHIIQRGNDRQPCFAGTTDYLHYRQELGEAALKHGCAIHAYVLMTNHVHLLVTPTDAGGVSRMMQAIGRRYVACFNARYGRTGTLSKRTPMRCGCTPNSSAHGGAIAFVTRLRR